MNKFSLAVCLTLLIGLTPAISRTPAAPAEAESVLSPLAIGNTWVYQNKADGIISTDQIVGMVLFDGQPWYLLRNTEKPTEPGEADPDEEPFVSEIWISHQDGVEYDAMVEVDDETGSLKLTEIAHYFRANVSQGDTYQPIPDDPGLKIEVLATDEKVKTPAGEFICTVYRETLTDEPGYSFTSYLAPGVGVVRYTSTDGEETFSADLIKYTLVKP